MPEDEKEQLEALTWSRNLMGLEVLGTSDQDYENLLEELAAYLDRLVVEDFNRLLSLLYRIDIAEEKATIALAENVGKETAGWTMTRLIIARQLQKLKTRKAYRQPKI